MRRRRRNGLSENAGATRRISTRLRPQGRHRETVAETTSAVTSKELPGSARSRADLRILKYKAGVKVIQDMNVGGSNGTWR
mmetsp:Transcript_46727/g.149188  ORF Transcript_46727/g.149188 Transcript_46727/m.149188 type:complete len:81 (-) Transcript_46727:836-1078(-)